MRRHEVELQLTRFGLFPDQPLHEGGQRPNEQQHLQPLAGARARGVQALAPAQVLGVAERLFDAHALRVELNDAGGGQMIQPPRGREQPRLARSARTFGAGAPGMAPPVDVQPMPATGGQLCEYEPSIDGVAAHVSMLSQIARLFGGLPIERRAP